MQNFTQPMLTWARVGAVACLLIAIVGSAQAQKERQRNKLSKNKLSGWSVLDAATFAEGPTSGTRIGGTPGLVNGQPVPFINKQPVQGISAILDNRDGTFLAMSDNGFGGLENSADYNLRLYKLKPTFKRGRRDRMGNMEMQGIIELSDPGHFVQFPIVNHFSAERVLTGADFDIESIQRAADGTLWIGDEFGPFLLHFSANGKLLEAPYALPDFENPGKEIRAPQNPYNEEGAAVRVMNAMRKHALDNGNAKYPVFSPWFVMLDDNRTETGVGSRENPSGGLKRANSEIFNVRSLQRAGFPVVVYTVNDTLNMNAVAALGVDGIISDRPDLLLEVVKNFDGNGDGQADFIGADGLIDINLFDAQGHRGARNLRPENTLPSMEAALDYLMTTLETDCGITKDGVAVLGHDPYIEAGKVRKADGTPYTEADEVLIKDLTLAEIQSTFIADQILPGRPAQENNLALSPVSVAFASQYGMIHPYVKPSLTQLFDFVQFYIAYYRNGEGSNHPEASLRWKNADRVRYNLETKLNPRTDRDEKGNVFIERTQSPEAFVSNIAGTIQAYGLQNRADIQSFDFRSLLIVHEDYPQIRTVCLFGDFPKIGDSGDGTNLQDQEGKNTPWLAGLQWPYRNTTLDHPILARGSGGYEGLALTKKGDKLLALLEKPLIGAPDGQLLISEFDLATKQFNGNTFFYQLNERGSAIGDFIMFEEHRGLVIERDNTQGDLTGFKAVYEIELNAYGEDVTKRQAVDLLRLTDNKGISGPKTEGVVGVGKAFAFPFVTIESVLFFGRKKIGILNDNNFPFSVGRFVDPRQPDNNEFIEIKLQKKLGKGRFLKPSEAQTEEEDNESQATVLSENPLQVNHAFPNPFEQSVNLVLPEFSEAQLNFQLLDRLGQVIYTGVQDTDNLGQANFDFSSLRLPEGLYLLRINAKNTSAKTFWIFKK